MNISAAVSARLRNFLVRLGGDLTDRQVRVIRGGFKYLEAGSILRQHGYVLGDVERWVTAREQLFDMIASEVGGRQALYMEFGVWKGHTTRYWCNLLTNPNSLIHGFDSFEGLPEDWVEGFRVRARGSFSTAGEIPLIDDSRVTFFKGWFDESLSRYAIPDHDVLIVNLDADLYSSTKLVLDRLAPWIVPGTYIYFDEFNCPNDELRAFIEFEQLSPYKFRIRGATYSMQCVVLQCVDRNQ